MRRVFVVALALVAGSLLGGAAEIDAAAAQHDTAFVAYTRFLQNEGDRPEVWIAHVDGKGKRRLAAGRAPSISPDARRVVYRGDCDATGACSGIYVISSLGGRPRLLSPSGTDVKWAPDSRRLAFVEGISLVQLDLTTGGKRVIVRGTGVVGWGFGFDYSPTGERIAYALVRGPGCFAGKVDIYVVAVRGGSRRRLTRDGCSAYPVWGPDGIAFARLIPYRGWGRHEIWRIDPDGTGRRTITGRLPARLLGQGITGLVPVAWSADGRRLLAGLANEFGSVPFAIDPVRGTMRKIAGSYADSPDGLSRDGRYVLVSTGNVASYAGTRVAVVTYGGELVRVIARTAGEASWTL